MTKEEAGNRIAFLLAKASAEAQGELTHSQPHRRYYAEVAIKNNATAAALYYLTAEYEKKSLNCSHR